MGSDGLGLPPQVVGIVGCSFFFFFVVLMVGEGGILEIFSGGGWLVGSMV